mgnify:CR=1 FL=1
MVRSSVTSKISVVDNAVFCKNTFHWFESNIFILSGYVFPLFEIYKKLMSGDGVSYFEFSSDG